MSYEIQPMPIHTSNFAMAEALAPGRGHLKRRTEGLIGHHSRAYTPQPFSIASVDYFAILLTASFLHPPDCFAHATSPEGCCVDRGPASGTTGTASNPI